MDVMIKIDPQYTNMIFTGYKPYEFREKVLKGMDVGYPLEKITAYIYETKINGGKGLVIGTVEIAGAYKVNYKISGDSTGITVRERFACIKSLYLIWCEKHRIDANFNEGWFKSKNFKLYQKEIGMEQLNFNYVLILDNPTKYEQPKEINSFIKTNGQVMKNPPKNMCHVILIETL